MKKVLLFLTAIFMIFATTGCVKYSYEINIDKNDMISVSEISAVNTKLIESMTQSMGGGGVDIKKQLNDDFSKNKAELEKDGFTVEQYDDGTFAGVKSSKKDIEFTKLIYNLPKGFIQEEGSIVLKKRLCRTQHKIKLNYDITKAQNDEEFSPSNPMGRQEYIDATNNSKEAPEYYSEEDGQSYSMEDDGGMGDAMNKMLESMPGMQPVSELTIRIPAKSKVLKHNATKVISDTVYQWDLSKDGIIEIELYYDTFDYSTLIGIISFILIFLMLGFIYQRSTENINI